MNILLNKIVKRQRMSKNHNVRTNETKKPYVVILLFSLLGVLIQSFIQNGVFNWMPFLYILYPPVILLNVLPVFLVILALYYLTGRIWIGCIVAYIPLIVLNVANYFKTVYRDEPLKMSDLLLVGEMNNITQNYEITLTFGIVTAIIIAVLAIIYAAKKLQTVKFKRSVKIIGTIAAVCIMILSYFTVYSNKDIYNSIPTFAEEYHDTSMAKHHGMLYTLLASGDATKYDKPEEYTDEYALQLLEENKSETVLADEKEKINIIAIMGEAFFDVRRGSKMQIEEGVDPYANYDEVKAEGYYGNLIVPGYGGSTESTEFEFLTGVNQYLLNSAMPTAYKTYITQPSYGLVQYFKDNGYKAVAFHPGYPWFYNRQGAYKNLGFDKFVSRDDMSWDTAEVNGYILDSVATEWIINEYTDHYEAEPETPFFNFTVTIQNHGPYGDSQDNEEQIYVRPTGMTDENYKIINNYLNGVKDTDMLLGEICAFAKTREEPVAVVFFGDHLPFFDEEIECYKAIGYDISHQKKEGLQRRHTVEYVMWCNESAEKIIGEVKTGEGPEISSNFLGTELLNYLGMKKSPYFEYVEKVQKTANIISPKYFVMNGRYVRNFQTGIKDDERKVLRDYKVLQYYNLRRYAKLDTNRP